MYTKIQNARAVPLFCSLKCFVRRHYLHRRRLGLLKLPNIVCHGPPMTVQSSMPVLQNMQFLHASMVTSDPLISWRSVVTQSLTCVLSISSL